jgi:peptidoglycan/xylan/chitin deacetylase (PgdA/CDA1 family)
VIKQRLKSVTQSAVTSIHQVAFDRGLPRKVGVYLHSLPEQDHDSFGEMCGFFRDEGYRFTGPGEFLDDPDERCVFVSFDDNYRTWYEAMPLFDTLDVRATFYVNTCAVRERDDADEIEVYFDRLGFTGPRIPLSAAELVALDDAGHTIGTHTHSHHRLTSISHDDALADITTGKEDLEAILGKPVVHFAYPYGMRRHFSEELRTACRAMGFETISNAIPGMQHAPQTPTSINRSGWDPHRPLAENLKRLSIDGQWFERRTGRSAVG